MPMAVKWEHPFASVDRQSIVTAGQLHPGERLQT